MSNQDEYCVLDGSVYWFSHETGKAWARHANGMTETWDTVKRGYSRDAAFLGYLILTEQSDRYNAVMADMYERDGNHGMAKIYRGVT